MALHAVMNTTRDDWDPSEDARSTSRPGKRVCLVQRHWKMLLTVYSVIVLEIIVTCVIAGISTLPSGLAMRHRLTSNNQQTGVIEEPFDLKRRSWGGFDERPLTATCYRQERTAMLLAFLLGSLGIDQFYAHHWPLAVFKLLTLGAGGIWWFVDVILWMVGGVYGTPGCPGGSKHSWQF
ncbi:hypothetical protein FPOA_13503 [Fusarium poae]|uniref:TM2 domain-containing protein n=1 Tax=Fusarium poae TaxID=36050 RepID=A0A1B8A5G3_FUSPO|nr:hypothetical protein FPOA_13503 [Fusarium poae]